MKRAAIPILIAASLVAFASPGRSQQLMNGENVDALRTIPGTTTREPTAPETLPQSMPTNQCIQKQTLDCSAGWVSNMAVPHLNYFNSLFGRACVRHDYCYRHGAATYGVTKAKCDNEFYRAMQQECAKLSWMDLITLGGSKPTCYVTAEQYYRAVQGLGGSSFRSQANSTCCPYAGPATTAQCGATPRPGPGATDPDERPLPRRRPGDPDWQRR